MALVTETSAVKEHSTFGASGASRWLACPASISLAEKAPPERESPYAEEGTKAHACLEFLVKNRQNQKAAVKTALKTWTGDMVKHALDALDWAEERQTALGGSVLLSEQKVDASSFTRDGEFGTLDLAVVQEFGRLVVVDYKYGAGYAVDPEGDDGKGNPQLIYYALALSVEYDHNFQDVELVVIQPRAYHESGSTTRSMVMTMDELLSWEPKFLAGVKRATHPQAAFQAGPHCKWCRATTICPELKDGALRQAQAVFSDKDGLASIPAPEVVPIANLSTMLKAAEKLKAWCKGIEDHAAHVLEKGGEIPGFKLVQKRGTRKWKDEAASAKEARKKFGDTAFTKPELLSPAQLEKAAKGHDDWVKARVTAESSGTTLVSADDPRPAVKPLEQVFGTKNIISVIAGGELKAGDAVKFSGKLKNGLPIVLAAKPIAVKTKRVK